MLFVVKLPLTGRTCVEPLCVGACEGRSCAVLYRSNGAPPEQFSELCNKKLAQNEEYWQQVGLDSCWGTTPWPLPAIRCLDQMRMYEIHYPGIPLLEHQKLGADEINASPRAQPLKLVACQTLSL
ncbi:uncharacterized protein LOC144672709 isoform X3 [Cetorhinus maximus]